MPIWSPPLAALLARSRRLSRRGLVLLASAGLLTVPSKSGATPAPPHTRRSDSATQGKAERRCPRGKKKCAGRCVSLKSNLANCGACGVVCDAGLTCRDGKCAPLLARRFGRKGKRPGEFDFPTDIAEAPDGTYFVADTFNQRIQQVSQLGRPLNHWGNTGAGLSRLDDPFGVGITIVLPDSQPGWGVWVADTWHEQVKLFSADGATVLRQIGGTQGTGPGEFNLPQRIATDPTGRVFTTDLNGARIQSWDANISPNSYRTWGVSGTGPGQFRSPTGIAYGHDGNVYVVDKLNCRVQVFTPNGAFLRAWGEEGTDPGQFREPRGIAYGFGDLVYVTDAENHNVQVFNPDGTFRFRFGKRGAKPGQLRNPCGITITAAGILVADSGNNRIQLFAHLPFGFS